jgi:hypothetical protein
MSSVYTLIYIVYTEPSFIVIYIHMYIYIYIDLPTGLNEDAALKKALEASVLESAPPRWNSETSGLAMEAATSGVGAMGWSPFPALSCSRTHPPLIESITCMRYTRKRRINGGGVVFSSG